MAQTVELPDVIASAIEISLNGVWTALPGRVESYDPLTQSANIQVTVQAGSIAESGNRRVETIAVLNHVPVIHLGGGGYRQVFPVAVGDTALVVFCSRSIAQWLVRGGIVDPATDHHHALSDGVALVGLRDHKHSLHSAPTDRMSIGRDNGPSIEISESEVRVGGNSGTQPTIMGTAYRSAETTFFAALSGLVGAMAVAVGALAAATPTLTSLNPLVLAAWVTAVGNVASLASSFPGAVSTFNAGAAGYLTTIAKVV